MNFYLVRHGETHANAEDAFQPEDDQLTERGVAQADTIAHRLAALPVSGIISSDLLRCKQTAERIATVIGKKVAYSPLFREKKEPSSLTGQPFAGDAMDEVRRERDEHLEDPTWHYEDEENFSEFTARAKRALALLLESGADQAIVTHGMFMKILLSAALFEEAFTPELWKKTRFGFQSSNTGLTVLQYAAKPQSPKWSVLTWNDHAHLG